jgi:hypothetical protein
MAHIPDDNDFNEFMNASAEEWSKPQEASGPASVGSSSKSSDAPTPSPSKANRWGSEPIEPTLNEQEKQVLKDKSKKWITILIIVLAVLCLCACVTLVGLPLLGVTLIPAGWFQF